MRVYRLVITMALATGLAAPALAASDDMRAGNASWRAQIVDSDSSAGSGSAIGMKPPGYLECVPYARLTSGIQIYGDAHTWWAQAQGHYATGSRPRLGAVMAIRPYANSHLGHVATVSGIVDSRTILLSHANWSVPGQVERNVTALDVSPNNDWSEVRVWYGPSHGLGTTHWPVQGFIYNARPGTRLDVGSTRLAQMEQAETPEAPNRGASGRPRHRDPIGAIIAGTY